MYSVHLFYSTNNKLLNVFKGDHSDRHECYRINQIPQIVFYDV